MSSDVGRDQLAIIRIQGMHSHRCEENIQRALSRYKGVHEVEVDFNSGLASVLFDDANVDPDQLMEAINAAGYHAVDFTKRQT